MFDNNGCYIGENNDKYIVLAFDRVDRVWSVSNELPYRGAMEKLKQWLLDPTFVAVKLTKVVPIEIREA